MIELLHKDCMELLKEIPNKFYDLAIVDPPYGIDVTKMNLGSGKYKSNKSWDIETPNINYWDELFRVSKNQIVWGANYFSDYLPPSMGWIFWNKNNGSSDFSDGEIAFSSFNRALRMFTFGLTQQPQVDIKNRFHPTQKPVKLYEWLLLNYAKQNDKILDTHGGSMSIALAVHNVNQKEQMNLSLTLTELDEDYYKAGVKRYENHIKQKTIFDI